MNFPDITICGLPEVQKTITPEYRYMISILSVGESVTRPPWIQPERHLVLAFEDLTDSSSPHWLNYAPHRSDIEKLIQFGRKVRGAQITSRNLEKVLIHCSAGRSRSPAAAYILLCDWYGAGKERLAAKKVCDLAWHCWPNPYMIQLGDEVLGRGGSMIENAVFEWPGEKQIKR